jgi:hypothetical protein
MKPSPVLALLFIAAMVLLLVSPQYPQASGDADDPVRRWWQEYDLRRNLDRPIRPAPPQPPPEHPCERYARIAYNVGLGLGPYSSDDPIITYIIEKRPDSAYIREVCYRNAPK